MDAPPPPPPPAPPLPPAKEVQNEAQFALKTRRAPPPGWALHGKVTKPVHDPWLIPPAGTYFFYGTLSDPALLAEILAMTSTPILRPAYVTGYEVKLWGQYPALVDGEGGRVVDGEGGRVVDGFAFDVPDEAAAAKLAAYETDNYCPTPCNVRFKDGEGPQLVEGFAFVFCGNPNDLSEGTFDLKTWLRRMKRATV